MAACCTAAFAPSFQRGASAFMPCMAAQVSSATTAITSPSFTTCRTPRTATAASAASPPIVPPSTGESAMSATFEFGGRASMPNTALPSTFCGGPRPGVGGPVDWEAIEGGIGRGGLHRDRAKIDLQLLGDQHRERGVRALPHLDLGDDEGDTAVRLDAHVGVQRPVGGCAAAWGEPLPAALQRDTEHQRPAHR